MLAPITAGADAYVQSDAPTTNFGTATTLNNQSGTPEARAYVKFTVSGVTGTITKATFRAFTQTSSGSGYELHSVADTTWTEGGLTYSNRPAVGALIGSAVNFTANTWTSVDVTSVVKANGTFSFEMNATSSNPKKYSSRESGANAPQLVLETSAPAGEPAAIAARPAVARPRRSGLPTRRNCCAGHRCLGPARGGSERDLQRSGQWSERQLRRGRRDGHGRLGQRRVATAPQFTANNTAGSFSVSASVAGVSAPATFAPTNAAASAEPARLPPPLAVAEPATVGTAYTTNLAAQGDRRLGPARGERA